MHRYTHIKTDTLTHTNTQPDTNAQTHIHSTALTLRSRHSSEFDYLVLPPRAHTRTHSYTQSQRTKWPPSMGHLSKMGKSRPSREKYVLSDPSKQVFAQFSRKRTFPFLHRQFVCSSFANSCSPCSPLKSEIRCWKLDYR